MKTITGEFQHALIVVDIDKRKIRKVVRKTCTGRRKIIDAMFILRRMQEEYHAKGKNLYMCFVDLEKSFDRVPRIVLESATRKGIP